jgi:hypothetical protein
MTADEIIVGIDDSLSARAAICWAAVYAQSTGAALPAIHVVASRGHRTCPSLP